MKKLKGIKSLTLYAFLGIVLIFLAFVVIQTLSEQTEYGQNFPPTPLGTEEGLASSTGEPNQGIPATEAVPIPSFPGAEGFGASTPGGRFGHIIFVTNLNDTLDRNSKDYLGSFRWAVEHTWQDSPDDPYNQGRIIVFKVGGMIKLVDQLIIKNPFITIAGQTAPGDGITLRGEQLTIATHDVIIRGIRVRVGDDGLPTCCRDGINISTTNANSDVYNVILDHCSVSWGIDENVSTWISSGKPYRTHDITVQWSIVSEGLYDSIHVDEGESSPAPHSMGLLLGPQGTSNISLHHNLLANNNARNPRLDGVNQVEVVNNVIYNWGNSPTDIGSAPLKAHIIGNYYKGGINSSSRDIIFQDNQNQNTLVFIDSNYVDFQRQRDLDTTQTRYPKDDQHAVILQQNSGVVVEWYTNSPPYFMANAPIFNSGLVSTSPLTAYPIVLSSAGAFPRDAVDQRVVLEVISRTGSHINSQNEIGGWPNYSAGIAPTDRDNDGIPDSWELVHGINPDSGDDASNVSDRAPSGYTWIEEYINSLLPIP